MHSKNLPKQLRLQKPQPKQILFLKDTHKHVGFGGARGGGKSWVVRFKAILLCLKYPGYQAAIVRPTYPEVQKNHIKPLKDTLCPGYAKFNESRKEFVFFNGSIIYAMYCKDDASAERFNGLELDALFLDEATHFKKEHIDKMRAAVRGANKYPKRIYYTCNPDGVSLGYIKRIFIDKVYEEGEDPEEYSFIQSLLSDNEILMKNDPSYQKYLESLPNSLKQAWLYGRWDVFEGMFFSSFRVSPDPFKCAEAGISVEEAKNTHRWTHVIKPFMIPQNWPITRSYDFGYAKPFSVSYYALSPENVGYLVLQFYGRTKNPNEGLKWTPEQQFKHVAEIERSHPLLKGRYIRGVADPSIWDGSRGKSVNDVAEEYGIYFDKGVNDRIAGWMQCQQRLMFDGNGYSHFYMFDTCQDAIRTIQLMVYDEKKVEDLDTSLEDHWCDDWRYWCMSNPIVPIEVPEAFTPIYDPLDQFKKEGGEWYRYNQL